MNRNNVGGLGHRTYSDRVLGVSLGWEAGFQAKTPETEKNLIQKDSSLELSKAQCVWGGGGVRKRRVAKKNLKNHIELEFPSL